MSWFPPGWYPGVGSGSGAVIYSSVQSVSATTLRNRIKFRLSRRSGSILDEDIKQELAYTQQAVLEASPMLPQFLLTFEQYDAVGQHSGIPLLGTTRILLRPEKLYWKDPSITSGFDGVELKRYDDLQQFNQLRNGAGERPFGYYWDGSEIGTFAFRPYVTGNQSYYLSFYARDPYTAMEPDPNDETLWTRFAGDYLMHTTGLEIAQFLRDETALNYFSQKRQEAYTRFVRQRTAVENADQELVMGD